jgi:ERCC4-type nuclease
VEEEEEDEWEVMLLLDVREHNNNARILSLLLQHDVRCEARQLSLGDVLWVARKKKKRSTHTHTHIDIDTQIEGEEGQQPPQPPPPKSKAKERGDGGDDEIMLRYVIERKTARDLASSIVDGRYTEQKGRMLGVGREVDRAFYLVEGQLHHQEGMQPATLRAALSSTHILHGIHVLHTDCLEQTITLLRKMHTRLQHSFATFLHAARSNTAETKQTYIHTHLHTLPLPPSRIIPFTDYQDKCRKSTRSAGGALTIKGLFIQQLCALPGISAAKAEAITSLFPTPVALVGGLVGMGEKEAVGVLAELPVPGQLKMFGQKNARVVWRVYVGEE